MEKAYSIENLESELATLNFENMDSTTETKLAAEIGQFLLERNKLLEITLEKNQQLINEQQAEIDKLIKQTHYFQDANKSSVKISEQLEQTLLELERSNQELLQQRSLDQDAMKELKERKEFLEQRCENLAESYEYIEEKLTKAQSKIDLCDKLPLTIIAHSTDAVNEMEPNIENQIAQQSNKDETKLSKKLEYLSTDLNDTKCEIAIYRQRMEKLEAQLTMLVQKNMELEDVIASKRSPVKSNRTTTSGCSSEKNKNSTSLAEELEAAKLSQSLDSFADGYFVTSTPPKTKSPEIEQKPNIININDGEENDDLDSEQRKTKEKKNYKNKLRREAYLNRISRIQTPIEEQFGSTSEQKVRINVCIEIDPDEQHVKEINLCHQHRLKCFARTIVHAYKDSVVTGLCKILGPFMRPPRNYLGTLLLWSNKKWIESNIRIM